MHVLRSQEGWAGDLKRNDINRFRSEPKVGGARIFFKGIRRLLIAFPLTLVPLISPGCRLSAKRKGKRNSREKKKEKKHPLPKAVLYRSTLSLSPNPQIFFQSQQTLFTFPPPPLSISKDLFSCENKPPYYIFEPPNPRDKSKHAASKIQIHRAHWYSFPQIDILLFFLRAQLRRRPQRNRGAPTCFSKSRIVLLEWVGPCW